MTFDMAAAFRSDLPPAAPKWGDQLPYSFVGGHNDRGSIPFGGLAEAAVNAIGRDGRNLASYNLGGSPLGLHPLREFVAETLLGQRADTPCDPDEILITSGSLQALDLVNALLIEPGDTVVVEQATYGGTITRLQRAGARIVGVELDEAGIVPDALERVLSELADDGVTAKYLYTIPTVQNPTGTVMPVDRRQRVLEVAERFNTPIFEDDCYADLVWGVPRPPTIRAVDLARDHVSGTGDSHVIYCGSFSKSIAPSLRVGYLVADQPVIQQLLALKTDAGTGALEQLTLAEYAPAHFDDHVEELKRALQDKCATMLDAVRTEFGSAATVDPPQGGIYIWVTLSEGVDTTALAPAAAAAGVEFNPGAGWSADPEWGSRRLRLCFGHVEPETIRAGVKALADVVARTTDLALPAP